MQYEIDYNHEMQFVNIKVNGKVNYKLAEEYSIEAAKLARHNNCHKFLIDHTGTKLEDAGIYKLHTDGAALEKFGFKSTDKIAIIISRDKDDRLFSEKTGQNAKWSDFKYFDTIDEGLDWLGKED
jgi:hypothetical protein